MNHGDAESTRGNGRNLPTRPGADNFGRAVSKVAVSQICESVGFQGFNESAVEALAGIAIRYLRDLGKTANFYANLAGRTECNTFDIIRGIEDLGISQGFPGASQLGHCVADSGTVRDIVEYVDRAEEIPFAQPVPWFPVVRNPRMIPSFVQMGETPPSKHIPAWLPAFPDPHTYIKTPMWNERVSDPRADKIEQARQQRKAERSLLSLQQRLVCNGTTGISKDDTKELQAVESNPFLAPPLQSGTKEISDVVLPAKLLNETEGESHVSVLEAFAPAIEAVRGGFCDDGDVERKVLPNNRPAIRLDFRTGKKFLGETFDLSLQKRSVRKTGSWLGRDEERDDKKRRAEYILRQSMENPQELTQL